jgi:hypothetical protein
LALLRRNRGVGKERSTFGAAKQITIDVDRAPEC